MYRYTPALMSSLAPLPNPTEPLHRDSELEQVLKSRAFEKTLTLKKLLTYLWEHQNENISEYAIATDALGRKADFDARLDATVRVLVSRLRQRLKEFYETEGADLATRIVIPLGTHEVQIVRVLPDTLSMTLGVSLPEIVTVPAAPPRGLSLRRVVWIQFGVILLLVVVNCWTLWLKNRQLQMREAPQAKDFPPIWRQFLDNGKTTQIIVPNPVFFTWKNGLITRDKTINDFAKRDDSPILRDLAQRLGSPVLSQQYVPSPDAFAAFQLDRYLDPQGTQMKISTTAQISPSERDHQNLVIVGNPHTLAPLESIVDQMSFQVDVDTRSVFDHRAEPSKAARFNTVDESESRITTPGIIASLPGGPGGNHILVLITTYYTSALVSYLTSDSGLRELRKAQIAAGDHPYFEAVIVSEIDGSTTLGGRLVEFRPYNP